MHTEKTRTKNQIENEEAHTECENNNENRNDANNMDSNTYSNEDSLTIANVLFAGSGHQKCIICRAEVNKNMVMMSKPSRLDLMIPKQMYAPHGVRCCKDYLWNDRLLSDVKINMETRQTPMAKLEPSVLLNLFNDLLTLLQEASTVPRLDFTNVSMSNEDYLAWTGWNKEQFERMFVLVLPHIRTSRNREARNALAMFWIKLKTNLSSKQIGSLFNISGDNENRRKVVSRSFDSVCQVLIDVLVPKYLGISHLSRSETIDHNTSFSNEFFGEKVTIIWDDTYFYAGKTSSHEFQRATYSEQEKRHLVKFISLCLADGYCLDILRPFFGTANDATITSHITTTKNVLEGWCEAGDVMIVDRGFRDVCGSLFSSRL